jgi:hypothetical protein
VRQKIGFHSVANYWPNYSARSAKKFGPTHNIHTNTNIIVLQTIYVSKVYKKFKISADDKYIFCKYLKLFVWIILLKKVRPLFGPFLSNLKKIRPPTFPAAQNFVGPLLYSAAEISAPWQHWRKMPSMLHLLSFLGSVSQRWQLAHRTKNMGKIFEFQKRRPTCLFHLSFRRQNLSRISTFLGKKKVWT